LCLRWEVGLVIGDIVGGEVGLVVGIEDGEVVGGTVGATDGEQEEQGGKSTSIAPHVLLSI
jgi:hypothetical protein